jgi:hypothetical protein
VLPFPVQPAAPFKAWHLCMDFTSSIHSSCWSHLKRWCNQSILVNPPYKPPHRIGSSLHELAIIQFLGSLAWFIAYSRAYSSFDCKTCSRLSFVSLSLDIQSCDKIWEMRMLWFSEHSKCLLALVTFEVLSFCTWQQWLTWVSSSKPCNCEQFFWHACQSPSLWWHQNCSKSCPIRLLQLGSGKTPSTLHIISMHGPTVIYTYIIRNCIILWDVSWQCVLFSHGEFNRHFSVLLQLFSP